jgi:hypothetical protein
VFSKLEGAAVALRGDFVPTGVIIFAIFLAFFNKFRAFGRAEVMGAREATPDMTGQIAAIR